jgi:hypothetical protein
MRSARSRTSLGGGSRVEVPADKRSLLRFFVVSRRVYLGGDENRHHLCWYAWGDSIPRPL